MNINILISRKFIVIGYPNIHTYIILFVKMMNPLHKGQLLLMALLVRVWGQCRSHHIISAVWSTTQRRC